MLDELINNFKILTKSLEIFYVIKDLKPVSRIILEDFEIEKIKLLEKYDLYVAISDFKIMNQTDENRGFSDKGIRIDKNSTIPGKVFVYISKSKEEVEKAKEFEKNSNHQELGKLLGYPKCCSKFFNDNFPIESKNKNDYTFATLKNSVGIKFPFYTNIALRHLDLTLLSHFPCSFNCKESIKIAKKHLDLIEKHSKKYFKILSEMLKGAVIYTKEEGVFLLKDSKIDEDKLKYNEIIESKNNYLFDLLKNDENKIIKIIDKNHIQIGKKDIKNKDNQDNNIGFMFFE